MLRHKPNMHVVALIKGNAGCLPQRFRNQLPALLPDWTPADRDTLAEVQAAWAKDPPAWP